MVVANSPKSNFSFNFRLFLIWDLDSLVTLILLGGWVKWVRGERKNLKSNLGKMEQNELRD